MTDEKTDFLDQAKRLSEQVKVALLNRLLDSLNNESATITPDDLHTLAETWATVMEKRGTDDFMRSLKDKLTR